MRIRMPGQSFQILTMLLQAPGELVSRDLLQQALWPADTYVDFEHGVNAAVKRLRDALGDSADNPTFIETLPRRGYRFIAPVTKPLDPDNSVVSSVPVEGVAAEQPTIASAPARRHVLPVVVVAGCLALVIGFVAILFFITREKVPTQRAQPRLVPLTTYTGREYQPALAPDGNRVAFAWSGPDAPLGRTASIYIKQIGEEHPLRLTSVPEAIDFGPDWSPDGTHIVFGRFPAPTAAPGTVEEGIYIVPATGGAERRVHNTNWTLGPIVDSRMAWASDGKTIAFADRPVGQSHYALFALNVSTLSARQVTSPPEASYGDIHVAFSPDAQMLGFLRDTKEGMDVYVMPAAGGAERRLTSDNRDLGGQRSVWLVGLTFTSDGHDIIVGGNGAVAHPHHRRCQAGRAYPWARLHGV